MVKTWTKFTAWLFPTKPCHVCGHRFNRYDLATSKVCFECWYSNDDAVQDLAWDVENVI